MANRAVVDVKNVQWCCPDMNAAYCLVKFSDIDEWLEYTAIRGDEVAHGNELFQLIDRGLCGDIPEYSGPEHCQIEAWNLLMEERVGYQAELDKLLPEVQLGLASPEKVERAKWLYGRIKDINSYHDTTYAMTFCYVNREVS
ncbi:hypothetical protein 10P302A_gene0045 [Pseudomonas phage 10P302A]|uniref:Uncharacterized protein n=1 Tax=Pseudomonas phage 10P302A TaxID=3038233 RepID=A0AAF0GKU5_9CAUD|nr:hypothetical protein 10P302A_gene0045 [Pseudomonas phage 10P302A]